MSTALPGIHLDFNERIKYFAIQDRNCKTEITLCYGSFATIVQNQKNECRFSRLTSFAFLLCRSNKCAVQSKGNQLNFEHETFMLMVDWCHLGFGISSLVVKNQLDFDLKIKMFRGLFFLCKWTLIMIRHQILGHNYRISANSFRGNYSRAETIQGWKLLIIRRF